MIARMLHLPLDKNKLHNKKSALSVKEPMAEYKIDNISIKTSKDLHQVLRLPLLSRPDMPSGRRQALYIAL